MMVNEGEHEGKPAAFICILDTSRRYMMVLTVVIGRSFCSFSWNKIHPVVRSFVLSSPCCMFVFPPPQIFFHFLFLFFIFRFSFFVLCFLFFIFRFSFFIFHFSFFIFLFFGFHFLFSFFIFPSVA